MRSLALIPLLAISLASCTFPIRGKDTFLATADQRHDVILIGYQTLARCFDERRTLRDFGSAPLSGPRDQFSIYPDLGLAELRFNGSDDAWFLLVQFVSVPPNATKVSTYSANPDWTAAAWKTIDACVPAAHPGPAQR